MNAGLAIVLCVASSCASVAYSYTPSGATRSSPSPPGCEFTVATTRPDGNLEDLGVLEMTSNCAHNATEFREAVAEQVCRAGGNLVVPDVAGAECYRRATVFRRR